MQSWSVIVSAAISTTGTAAPYPATLDTSCKSTRMMTSSRARYRLCHGGSRWGQILLMHECNQCSAVHCTGTRDRGRCEGACRKMNSRRTHEHTRSDANSSTHHGHERIVLSQRCCLCLSIFCHRQQVGSAWQVSWEDDIMNIQVETCCTEERKPWERRGRRGDQRRLQRRAEEGGRIGEKKGKERRGKEKRGGGGRWMERNYKGGQERKWEREERMGKRAVRKGEGKGGDERSRGENWRGEEVKGKERRKEERRGEERSPSLLLLLLLLLPHTHTHTDIIVFSLLLSMPHHHLKQSLCIATPLGRWHHCIVSAPTLPLRLPPPLPLPPCLPPSLFPSLPTSRLILCTLNSLL